MKIGIITQYYKSLNYGGNLQSYALCKYIQSLGYNVEQISYDMKSRHIKNKGKYWIKNLFFLMLKNLFYFVNDFLYKGRLNTRKKKILDFNNNIAHSKFIYKENNMSRANEMYDVFITGSDQVWLPISLGTSFFLNFSEENKYKMSYAASISKDTLTEKQLHSFQENLKGFDAISVREYEAVELLTQVSKIPVEWTLDPTMLLTREDWDLICTERIIPEPYLFCYFLGDDNTERNLAMKYALDHHLKIITLPNLLGHYRKCDKNFGDRQLYDISPQDFISLIKNAEIIFTDSFHATVFSGIYQKQYFVFERSGAKEMHSRIYSLTELFETQERFCDTTEKQTIEYISSIKDIDYNKELIKLKEMKSRSKNFLIENLRKAQEQIKI